MASTFKYSCTYCRLEDIRGLYPIHTSAGPLCRDCYDLIPDYIDRSQWDRWLRKAKLV